MSFKKLNIKVCGVGGAGIKIVDALIKSEKLPVGYFVVDGNNNSLKISECQNKLQLDSGNFYCGDGDCLYKFTSGQKAEFEEIIGNCDMLILTAGMGGGTGSAVLPAIAKIARDLSVLTIAVVCTPFAFEGEKRALISEKGLDKLRSVADTVIEISCERLRSAFDDDKAALSAIMLADKFSVAAVNTLIAPISLPNVINISFEDVEPLLRRGGNAYFGSCVAENKDSVTGAVKHALNGFGADKTAATAKGLIIYLSGGRGVTFDEVSKIAEYIYAATGGDREILFAVGLDDEATEFVKISVIAV